MPQIISSLHLISANSCANSLYLRVDLISQQSSPRGVLSVNKLGSPQFGYKYISVFLKYL